MVVWKMCPPVSCHFISVAFTLINKCIIATDMTFPFNLALGGKVTCLRD